MAVRIIEGDCLTSLAALPAGIAQTCVTSPPYYGLRDYGVDGQIGLEPTPAEYVARLVAVFREVKRVLRDDGCAWLNLGDSYAASGVKTLGRNDAGRDIGGRGGNTEGSGNPGAQGVRLLDYGAKPKDLLGIPWEVAFALRSDGWFLRSAIVWAKPNPMPESVRDRPTSAYEMVFLLSKRAAYFYDAEAIKEDATSDSGNREHFRGAGSYTGGNSFNNHATKQASGKGHVESDGTRNARNVWTIATQPYSGAHFATMPPDLAERCIKAGSSERGQCPHCASPWARVVERESRPNWQGGDGQKHDGTHYRSNPGGGVGNDRRDAREVGWSPTCSCPAHQPVPQVVLDPFGGAGTTGLVADRLGRSAILCELNAEYASLARRRLTDDAPLLAVVA